MPTPGTLGVAFASPVRLVAGASAKVHVKVDRAAIPGTVSIVGKNLPEGVGVVQLDLKEGVSEGDLELNATAMAKQGDAKGATVVARAESRTTADSPMSVFVRGAPGTPDKTYGTDGSMDLGETTSGYAAVTISPTTPPMIYVHGGGSIQRFAIDGTPDATFPKPPIADVSYLVAGKDSSVYALTSERTVVKFLKSGSRDATFGTAGEAGPFGGFGANHTYLIALDTNDRVLYPYKKSGSAANPDQLVRLNVAGQSDSTFSYPGYLRGVGTTFSALLAQPDGTTLAAVSDLDGAALLRIGTNGTILETKETPTADNITAGSARQTPSEVFLLHVVPNNVDRALTRFGLDLTRDYNFGTGGFARLPPWVEGSGTGLDFTIDAKSRIVATCFTRVAGMDQFVISRFLTTGKPDTSLAPSGFVAIPSEPSGNLRIMESDPERVVIAGARGAKAFIARFWM